MGKPREFGRKVLIDEVDGGIISRYELLEEVGREHPHLPASLEAHQEHFGGAPELLAADRGLYSEENERLAQELGVIRNPPKAFHTWRAATFEGNHSLTSSPPPTTPHSAEGNTRIRYQKPSEKPHERANRLTMRRLIATYMNTSPVSGSRS